MILLFAGLATLIGFGVWRLNQVTGICSKCKKQLKRQDRRYLDPTDGNNERLVCTSCCCAGLPHMLLNGYTQIVLRIKRLTFAKMVIRGICVVCGSDLAETETCPERTMGVRVFGTSSLVGGRGGLGIFELGYHLCSRCEGIGIKRPEIFLHLVGSGEPSVEAGVGILVGNPKVAELLCQQIQQDAPRSLHSVKRLQPTDEGFDLPFDARGLP